MPLDIATQEPFPPISTLLLQIASKQQHFSARWWGAADVWKELGGLVRRNETSTWIAVPKKEEAYIFNVEQVDGEDVDQFRHVELSVAELGEVDRTLIQRVMGKIGIEESGFLTEDSSGLLYELAQWAGLGVCEVEPLQRDLSTEICAGWLATSLR